MLMVSTVVQLTKRQGRASEKNAREKSKPTTVLYKKHVRTSRKSSSPKPLRLVVQGFDLIFYKNSSEMVIKPENKHFK